MMKFIRIVLVVSLIFPEPARADLFGADVAVSLKILYQMMQNYYQLKKIKEEAEKSNQQQDEINRGVELPIGGRETVFPKRRVKTFSNWDRSPRTRKKMRKIYGEVDKSNESSELLTDDLVQEAIALNNEIHEYSGKMDQEGSDIKEKSEKASSGNASRITSHSMGTLVHMSSQNLRSQAVLLKMKAHQMALENKERKANTMFYKNHVSDIEEKLLSMNPKFSLPRF